MPSFLSLPRHRQRIAHVRSRPAWRDMRLPRPRRSAVLEAGGSLPLGKLRPNISATWKRPTRSPRPSRPNGRASSTDAAALTGDEGIGAAVREYEALEDLMGRIGSFAGLTYFSDTSNPANGKLYGDAQAKLTDMASHLLFFALELNRIDDAVIDSAARNRHAGGPLQARGSSICAWTSPTSSMTRSSSSSSKNR